MRSIGIVLRVKSDHAHSFMHFHSLIAVILNSIASCKHYTTGSPKLVSAAHTNTSLSTVATSVSRFLLINVIGSLDCTMEYLFFKSPIICST